MHIPHGFYTAYLDISILAANIIVKFISREIIVGLETACETWKNKVLINLMYGIFRYIWELGYHTFESSQHGVVSPSKSPMMHSDVQALQ